MSNSSPKWMYNLLWFAGLYNLVWGASVIIAPNLFFDLASMPRPTYPMIWQCVGMIVGVYGVGYIAAAYAPARHWPIVLVGFLGKIFGPIGFAWYLVQGAFPVKFGMLIIFNDLIWWLPFGLILLHAYRSKEMRFKLVSD
ncbi:MAG: alkyl hydroperoxide reductase [Saprospiraceae bacterium]|nr:alkyl hydroperoxide reductase [Saprospiraceae bacterium]